MCSPARMLDINVKARICQNPAGPLDVQQALHILTAPPALQQRCSLMAQAEPQTRDCMGSSCDRH